MSPNTVVMFVLLVVAALLPHGLVLQYANWQHSKFRNRLWNLRDGLADELLTGRIEFSPSAAILLDVMETHIRNTRRHTFVDVWIAYHLLRDIKIASISDQLRDDSLRAEDRAILMRYFEEFREVTFSYLKRNSPSGWLVSLRLKLSQPAEHRQAVPRRPISPELKQQVEQVELRGIPKLTPPSRTVRRGPILENTVTAA
ncbi:hypothetical protein [Micromonospora sp. NPDC047134]|uniref:hypothetical protein n=1 Tax=Micromonospora sp. NPDC047134 TaxID=3154340 RepID=UPI0033FD577C